MARRIFQPVPDGSRRLSGALQVQESLIPIGTAQASMRWMMGAQFRSFQETGPDHEGWGRSKASPIMMVPPHSFASADRRQFDAAAERRPGQTRPRTVCGFASGIGPGATLAPVREDYRLSTPGADFDHINPGVVAGLVPATNEFSTSLRRSRWPA